MLLVAAMAIGMWLAILELRVSPRVSLAHAWYEEGAVDSVASIAGFFLGGLSLLGPPLLLALARRRPWGAGRILWFADGIAAVVLCPPAFYYCYKNYSDGITWAVPSIADGGNAFLWCVPLMSLFVAASLVFGGWLRGSRRRRMWRSWQEVFGIILTLAWALVGLYLLVKTYRNDLSIPY